MTGMLPRSAMDTIMSATCILGLSQELLRVWIDEDVGQVLQKLTRLFIVRWAAQMHHDDAVGRPRTPRMQADRVMVQEAIIHLYLAAAISSGGELADYQALRKDLILMVRELDLMYHLDDVTAKLVNALVKVLESRENCTWPVDTEEMVRGIEKVRSIRGPRRHKL